MERGNLQPRRSDGERTRRSTNYESKNRPDSRGYGARPFDNYREGEQYIDQDSLRRRSSGQEENSMWTQRAANERSTNRGYVQGRQGDWSQFEAQESYPSNRDTDHARNRPSWENSSSNIDRERNQHFQSQRQFGSDRPMSSGYRADQFRQQSSESLGRQGPYTGKGPKGYKRSDERIVEEACLRLERAGDVDASEIEVTCSEGVITLRGKVEDRATKRKSEECVEDIYGVRDVMNELQVNKGLFTNLFDSSDGNVARDELVGRL